jgi:hypothetical protein
MDSYPAVFDEWRKEISGELTTAQAGLDQAITALTVAEQSARDERTERIAFENAIERRDGRQPMPGALAVRCRQHQERLRVAEVALARSRNEVESLRRRVTDLRDAAAQLDELAPSEQSEPG